ncbi:hypothetical protein [Gynurincola endophyticus]|uniref:hypothetical protein n=1 Tax=Gynurincola endophyticus TaxID=2479004 RepID=UPI000F8E0DE0|nr:hypothetical protein [Gynurincola endophyticus]
MSDRSISIVPRISVFPDKEKKAGEIVKWLISLNVVNSIPTHCLLGREDGFAVAEGAKLVVEESQYLPFNIDTCGLEIITQRNVFHTGEYAMDCLICPCCKTDIVNESWDFLGEWYSVLSDEITCPACSIRSDIHSFSFFPQWGFSDLGFTFWNWPSFKREFLNEFSNKLNVEIDVVYTHV